MKSHKQSGYTLITTMLIMIILFVIGAAGAMLVYYGNLTSGAMTNYQKAYYNADYGLQKVAYNVLNNNCNCQNNGCGISKTTLSTGGTVEVLTQSDVNDTTCFIDSIGTGQAGGEIQKAIFLNTTQPWAAIYMGSGAIMVSGSGSVSGCDPQCPVPAVEIGSPLSLSVIDAEYYCSQIAQNNLKGAFGNPPIIQNNNLSSAILTYFNDIFTALNGIMSNVNNLTNNSNCTCNGYAEASNNTVTCNGAQTLNSSCSAYYIYGPLNIDGSNDFTGKQIYASGINITGNTLTIQGGLLDAYINDLSIDVKGNSEIGTSDDPTLIISQGMSANVNINMHGTSTVNGVLWLNNLSSFGIGNSSINGAMTVNMGLPITIMGNASINFDHNIVDKLAQEYPSIIKPPNCVSPQQYLYNAVTLY